MDGKFLVAADGFDRSAFIADEKSADLARNDHRDTGVRFLESLQIFFGKKDLAARARCENAQRFESGAASRRDQMNRVPVADAVEHAEGVDASARNAYFPQQGRGVFHSERAFRRSPGIDGSALDSRETAHYGPYRPGGWHGECH